MAGKIIKKTICVLAVITCLYVISPHDIIHNEDHDDVDIVKRVDIWENGIRFAQWNNDAETDKEYLVDWVDVLEKLIKPGIVINYGC